MKCYLAFDYFLKCFHLAGLADHEHCVPVSIYTNTNHAFLVINNEFLCDPLFGTVTKISDPAKLYNADEYFGIRADWECYTSKTNHDDNSSLYTYNLVKMLDEKREELERSNHPLFSELVDTLELCPDRSPWKKHKA